MALIVLIPKPNKDPLYCDSYRLISLINTDHKILSKILALRLNRVITVIISADQTGFIQGRSTHINICRLFTNLQNPNALLQSRALVTLDIQKAFDSGEWPYLFYVLERFGFGKNFLT